MRHSTLYLPAILLATTLAAQTTKVVPGYATNLDANEQSYFPFVYDKTRVQQVWDGATICTTSAVLTGLAMRRDAADPNPCAAFSISTLVLSLGYSSSTPATMSTTFASNRTGTQTQVYSGAYNVPANPPVGGTGPFNIAWAISTPFVYMRANGNLLFEFEIPGIANVKNRYFVDAVRTNPAGAANQFGTSGRFASQETPAFACATPGTQIVPGGSFTLDASGLLSLYPAMLYVGASRTAWGSLPLPLDLTAFNAPGNSVYASADIMFGLPLTLNAGKYSGSRQFNVPNIPTLGGQSLYAQCLFLNPPSNGLGLVLSNAIAIDLGTNQPITQVLGASDSTSTSGFFWFGGSGDTGGPVVQFTGAFN